MKERQILQDERHTAMCRNCPILVDATRYRMYNTRVNLVDQLAASTSDAGSVAHEEPDTIFHGGDVMARSESRRQKQLAKKKAKRAARQGALKRLKSQSPAQRIVAARSAVRHCLLQRDDLEEKGIGSALFSVELPSGEIGTVVFLIDRYCLGVKDVFGRVMHASDYSDWIDEFRDRTDAMSIAPATLRRLVDDVVAFARSCGLSPHPDYNKWRAVLSDVDPEEARETFEMGRDGKPWFMAGPFDSESRCRAVVAKLEEHCGPGNYDYVVPIGPGSEFLDEFEDDWEDEDIGIDGEEDDWEAGRIEYFDEPHV